MLFVYRVLYAFKVLTPTCGAVSFPLSKICHCKLFPFIPEALVTVWNKYYCQYQKENKIFTMIPFNQVTGKGVSDGSCFLVEG